jgi:hypothetical protein
LFRKLAPDLEPQLPQNLAAGIRLGNLRPERPSFCLRIGQNSANSSEESRPVLSRNSTNSSRPIPRLSPRLLADFVASYPTTDEEDLYSASGVLHSPEDPGLLQFFVQPRVFVDEVLKDAASRPDGYVHLFFITELSETQGSIFWSKLIFMPPPPPSEIYIFSP